MIPDIIRTKILEIGLEHVYMDGVDRSFDRVKATGEVFTPTELALDMIENCPIEEFGPGKTVLDPACGDGQLLLPILCIKIFHFGESAAQSMSEIFGVDIMRDNVDLCRRRLVNICTKYTAAFEDELTAIASENIIVGNAIDPEEWCENQTWHERKLIKDRFLAARNALDLW